MLSSHTEETEQDQFQLSVLGPHDQPVPPGADTGQLAYTPSASAAAEDLHPFPSQGHRYSRGAGQGLFDTMHMQNKQYTLNLKPEGYSHRRQ